MLHDENDFSRARGRLQAINGSGSFPCWVEEFSPTVLRIQSRNGTRPGTKVLAALYGAHSTALCIAQVQTCTVDKSEIKAIGRLPGAPIEDKVIVLHVLGETRFIAPLGTARYAIEPMTAMLKTIKVESSVTILDLSPSGLGFVDTRQYKPDQLIEIQLLRGTTFRSVRGHVRYSKKEEGLQNVYRTGMRFLTSSQLDERAWMEYADHVA